MGWPEIVQIGKEGTRLWRSIFNLVRTNFLKSFSLSEMSGPCTEYLNKTYLTVQ